MLGDHDSLGATCAEGLFARNAKHWKKIADRTWNIIAPKNVWEKEMKWSMKQGNVGEQIERTRNEYFF